MTIHFVRSLGRLLFIPDTIDTAFGVAMRDTLDAAWSSVYLGWEIDSSLASQAWTIVAQRWGMRAMCFECFQDTCVRVAGHIAARERQHAEMLRQFWSKPGELGRPRREQPMSTSTELEIRPAARPGRSDPVKQAAAGALGLGWPVEREEIVRAFRKAAFANHPDRGGSDAVMLRILDARDVLLG